MWCARCEENVAVEFTAGQRSAHCALCQHPLPGALLPEDGAALPHVDAEAEAPQQQPSQSASQPGNEHATRAERRDNVPANDPPPDSERRLEHAGGGFRAEPPCWDDWELEDALARARWAAQRDDGWRIDVTHGPSEETAEPREAPPAYQPAGALAWLTACLGLTAVAFGGVALGWSLLGHRADLWNVGLLAALAGQLLLLLGLLGCHGSRRSASAVTPRSEPRRASRPLSWPQHGAAVLHAPLPEQPSGP